MDKFEKGTILYDLQPYCNALLPLMRDEKDKKGATYQEISDTTGITMDNIKRFYTGEHKQPSVYKIAALCHYFGLSMDALFGFVPSDKTVAYTELEEKDAEIEALRAKVASQQDDYERRLSSYQDFTRITHPENFERVTKLPLIDTLLEDMQTRDFSFSEVMDMCNITY